MASNAYRTHFETMIKEAEQLRNARIDLRAADRRRDVGAINRAIVIACVSAWEAYVEQVVREAVEALRPAAQPFGAWASHKALVTGQLARFNTPNPDGVKTLLTESLGLLDLPQHWAWPEWTPGRATARLVEVMRLRHQIALGLQPRPVVENAAAARLAVFFRDLARTTDRAVRHHLVTALGVASPWPA